MRATGMVRNTITAGIREVNAVERGAATPMAPTRGDPESPLLWAARSQRNLVKALAERGHATSAPMVARLLKALGYSLQANSKRLEGAQHPDRDAQFDRDPHCTTKNKRTMTEKLQLKKYDPRVRQHVLFVEARMPNPKKQG